MSNQNGACGAGGEKSPGKWRVTVVKARNPSGPPPTTTEYDRQLIEVLRTRDVFKFRHFLAASGRGLPDDMMLDTLKMATLMHQMILNFPDLSDLHEFSRQWINDNTFLPRNNSSLNEAARRQPGQAAEDPTAAPPPPGRRTIFLREVPPGDKAGRN